MSKFINSILIIVTLIISSQLLYAQQDTSAVTFYKPSEIPVQIENATSFLVQQKSGVLSPSMVTTAKMMLENFEKKFEKLNAISDTTRFNSYNSVQLRNINHDWITLQSESGESLILISERTKVLDEGREKLQTLLYTWEYTRERFKENQIPTELLNSVNNLEMEIKASLEILNGESNNLHWVNLWKNY